MKELLKIYLSLGRKELSPRQLVKDFSISARDSVSLQMAKAFYDDLINRKEVIVSEWNNLFQLGGHNDNNVKSIKERKRVLAGYFQTEEARIDESAALFALQTTYTIILKLIAYNVIVDIYLKKKDFSLDFSGLSGLPADILQNRMREIDSGDMFEQMGFTNLLETDFFSWYLEKPWKESQTAPLRRIMEVLDEYDVGQRLFGRENVHDFFKELYQSLIPKEVRHSLGEYYTEDWLADHVIRHRISKVGKKDDWRAIDPCCGSGTFVMKLIEQLLEQNNLLNRSLVETITDRIQGHDLNPLAVLTCKINYFLVLSRFLIRKKTERLPFLYGSEILHWFPGWSRKRKQGWSAMKWPWENSSTGSPFRCRCFREKTPRRFSGVCPETGKSGGKSGSVVFLRARRQENRR